MKFKKLPRKQPAEYERDLIAYWKENKTFEKSVGNRPEQNAYVFYDGPPFITGVPHHGTLLSSVVKDAVPRYQTMKGHRVERVWGWDCHGLPAEVFTEQKLGIKDKRDIGTKISLEEYIVTCRNNMVQTGSLWEDTIDRVGRWVDFRGAYKTMDASYMESVWWAFSKLYEAGKIYEGEKVLLYCTRDATPISKAEVAMDNSYQDITDPSVYVKFKLTDESAKKLQLKELGADKTLYLLAWTTTPWTLNANTALAVNQDLNYEVVDLNGEYLVLASQLVEKALTNEKHQPLPYKKMCSITGRQLVELRYEPLFADRGAHAHQIWHADFVHAQEGTGIAHEAPAYGEEDYALAKANGVPLVLDTDEEGYYTEGEWQGQQIWEINKEIAKTLHERGLVLKVDYIRHQYPHCHRCGTKLQYRAHASWFMDIDGQRQEMLELNGGIKWFPPHIKHGRFQKNIEQAPDWNLSRDRFWATAMPVWKAIDKEGKEHVKVVGSYDELELLSGQRLEDYHRPWIDNVTFEIDGLTYKRIDKVLDCWFESGSMPFAQFHYPFENQEKFETNFPGDFIAEYVGQARAWFYYLHVISTGIFGKEAFKNVIVTGVLAGNDGRKMSKSLGNYTDPTELMDQFSADALRLFYLSSPLLNGEDVALVDKDVADIQRRLNMVWNVYDFFATYAEVDGWEWDGQLSDPLQSLSNILDIWVVSRLHSTIMEVDEHMQAYNLPKAIRPIMDFIEDLSNWYVRRSRKRFWKNELGKDKNDAYGTLHYSMVQLSKALAPFAPFMAEDVYRRLTNGESVHLTDWPEYNQASRIVLDDMQRVRDLVTEGLSQRADAGIKVRQPLADAVIMASFGERAGNYSEIVTEELNLKEVKWLEVAADQQPTIKLNLELTDDLKQEGTMRELIRAIQNSRKNAGLKVDDRIKLQVASLDNSITEVFQKFSAEIFSETLCIGELEAEPEYREEVKVDGQSITVSLSKSQS